MKPRTVAAGLGALAVTAAGCYTPLPPPPPPPPAAELHADVGWLGDEAHAGRELGSAGRDSAAAYLVRRFRDAGLRPVVPTCDGGVAACPPSFRHRFEVRTSLTGGTGWNILGMVDGTDPRLRGQVIVVGAHYDHIGRLAPLSRDPDRIGPRPGADDNASGTAGMLELARRVSRRPVARSVLFVAFDAEELGLIGSAELLDAGLLPLDSITAMINLDMIGRLRSDRVTVYGTGSDERWEAILERANRDVGLDLRLVRSGGSSDHLTFIHQGVPAVHFFTGLHSDYHSRSDTVDRLNVYGMWKVVELAENVIREVAGR